MNSKWFSRGDWSAFFGLSIDNLAVMISLFSLLTFAGIPNGYTSEFVLTRMLPGTALGVLAGDLAFTLMAWGLAKKLKSETVTAMPLGLDTPSTFGMAFLVLLPALAKGNELYPQDHHQAMTFGWNVGLGVLILTGLIKVFFFTIRESGKAMGTSSRVAWFLSCGSPDSDFIHAFTGRYCRYARGWFALPCSDTRVLVGASGVAF